MRVREALAAAAARLAAASETPAPRCRAADGARARHCRAKSCCSTASTPKRRRHSKPWSSAASRHEPVAYITGRRAFWTIELEVGPGVAGPPPRQRDPDRGRAGPFRRRRAGAHPRSRHRSRHPAARRARPMARGDRPRRRCVGRRRSLMPGATPALGSPPRRIPAGRLGRGHGRAVRPHPVQPALCRGRRRAAAATSPRWEPREALYAGADGLDAYRRARAAGRAACSRRGASPASKSAPARRTRCRAFRRGGFHDRSRSDLNGVERCLIVAA